MAWEVEFTNEFETWWEDLNESQQISITAGVGLLEEHGPTLDYPFTSAINSSRHSNMRELRIQSGGRPFRVFYAFDPRRTAILLIGGDKTGNDRFYNTLVNRADELYDQHIVELRLEGLLQ